MLRKAQSFQSRFSIQQIESAETRIHAEQMALNPSLDDRSLPILVGNEALAASRPGISCAIDVEGLPTLAAAGTLYLTTLRLVFVAHSPKTLSCGTCFSSFAFPLEGLTEEKFNQPVFGCNNISGTVQPLEGSVIGSPVSFKLYFKQGGAGTFLRIFFGALRQCRAWASQRNAGSQAEQLPVAQVVEAAYDPQDPTSVYIVK